MEDGFFDSISCCLVSDLRPDWIGILVGVPAGWMVRESRRLNRGLVENEDACRRRRRGGGIIMGAGKAASDAGGGDPIVTTAVAAGVGGERKP